MASALERYYDGMGNVVLRDEYGNPSVFVRHPKQKSNEFDPILPNAVHPAFMCGAGVYDDAVLWGKYPSSQLTPGGRYYSLPNAAPAWETYASCMANARVSYGTTSITEMTVADYGLMVLKVHAGECDPSTQRGNNYYGHSRDDSWAATGGSERYTLGQSLTVGTLRWFAGWEWMCIQAHTTSALLLPPDAPSYWKKIRKVGGTPVVEQYDKTNTTGDWDAKFYQTRHTLTGSGPKSWYFNGDPTLEADVAGNIRVRICDLAINNGEILIIPYNAAGDGSVDPTNQSLYKAILPNSTSLGYEFVAPGTAGTVHYDWVDNHLILKAGSTTGTGEHSVAFNEIGVDAQTLPNVPSILYELGLAPIPGTRLDHNFEVKVANSTWTVPTMGIRCIDWGTSPVRFIQNMGRDANMAVGSRLRAREIAAS